MATFADRTILLCEEFAPIEAPFEYLFKSNKISLYPGVDKYFDIDYRGGRIVIAPKSYVGLIPLNSSLAIHVLPRFPIENLFGIIQRSSATLRFIEGHTRSYELLDSSSGDPLEILAVRFATLAERIILRQGVLQRYIEVEDPSPFSGSLDVSDTVVKYRSRGIVYRQTWREDQLTERVVENSLIKSALIRVADYCLLSRKPEIRKLLPAISSAMNALGLVEPLHSQDRQFDDALLTRLIRALPPHQLDYGRLLWLSFTLVMRRGLAVESTGGIQFDTFVVNLAETFEEYIRTIVRNGLNGHGIRVRNGNIDPLPLFRNQREPLVKPDIYLEIGRRCIAIIDAKYKPAIKASDRYEVLAFCEAAQVKRAIVVSPHTTGQSSSMLGRTPGGIEFWGLKFDLAAPNLEQEEREFLERFRSILGPSAPVAN